MIRTHSPFLALLQGVGLSALLGLASGCENPDPTAPVALPDERPMPVWGMDFGKAPAATLDPEALVRPASPGGTLFQNHCASCHGSTAGGTAMGPAINGPSTMSKSDALLASTVMAGKAAMPSFKGRLSDAQISSILTWLRTQDTARKASPKEPKKAEGGEKKPGGVEPSKNVPNDPPKPVKAPGAPKSAPVGEKTRPVSTRPGY